MFADGWDVEIFDISAAASVVRSVVAHTATTVTLSAAPGFVIEAGVDFMRIAEQDAAISARSTDGYVGTDFVFQMPDDENDGTAAPVTRWR
jgi:hypothetical protein